MAFAQLKETGWTHIVADRTHDIGFIKSVVGSMWDDVAEDGQSIEGWEPEVVSECWLNINDMAAWCLHAENSTTLIVHAHVLKAYRYASEEIGLAVWAWISENCDYEKVNASIPFIHPNVKKYAERVGMVQEGINRFSYCKNGEIVDQWLMGITRDEMKEMQ